MKIKKQKIKKVKFIPFSHLDLAYAYEQIRITNNKTSVPCYRGVITPGSEMPSMNVFREDGTIPLKNIRYVKISVPSNIINSINIKHYKFEGKGIKIVQAGSKYLRNNNYIGLMMPIEIFKILLIERRMKDISGTPDNSKLIYIMNFIDYPYSVKLYDKNKHCIAWVLPNLE